MRALGLAFDVLEYGKIEIYGATIDYRYDIFGGPPNNI